MPPPIMIPSYRARCCGTCKHNFEKFVDGTVVDCELGADPIYIDIYSICTTNYEPEEY